MPATKGTEIVGVVAAAIAFLALSPLSFGLSFRR
jgi:hypothetical protein